MTHAVTLMSRRRKSAHREHRYISRILAVKRECAHVIIGGGSVKTISAAAIARLSAYASATCSAARRSAGKYSAPIFTAVTAVN